MGQHRILLVDDEPPVRAVLRRILKDPSRVLDEAGSLAEGRKRMAEGGFDLLIADLRLGDGSGWDLVKEARERHPKMPVLVITGSPEDDSEDRAEELQVTGYVNKPFDITAMRKTVAEALGRGTGG
ncbi:MAG: response regulator [Elusimicrobiota bacterium]